MLLAVYCQFECCSPLQPFSQLLFASSSACEHEFLLLPSSYEILYTAKSMNHKTYHPSVKQMIHRKLPTISGTCVCVSASINSSNLIISIIYYNTCTVEIFPANLISWEIQNAPMQAKMSTFNVIPFYVLTLPAVPLLVVMASDL